MIDSPGECLGYSPDRWEVAVLPVNKREVCGEVFQARITHLELSHLKESPSPELGPGTMLSCLPLRPTSEHTQQTLLGRPSKHCSRPEGSGKGTSLTLIPGKLRQGAFWWNKPPGTHVESARGSSTICRPTLLAPSPPARGVLSSATA